MCSRHFSGICTRTVEVFIVIVILLNGLGGFIGFGVVGFFFVFVVVFFFFVGGVVSGLGLGGCLSVKASLITCVISTDVVKSGAYRLSRISSCEFRLMVIERSISVLFGIFLMFKWFFICEFLLFFLIL